MSSNQLRIAVNLTLTLTLTFGLSTTKPNHLFQTKFEHIAWDHSFFSYAADKQTNKQTDGAKHSTHVDLHNRRR